MADEADLGNVLAIKIVGTQAAYRPGPRKGGWKFGSTDISQYPSLGYLLPDRHQFTTWIGCAAKKAWMFSAVIFIRRPLASSVAQAR